MSEFTKTCPVCGKKFEPIRKTKKCCSYKCANIHWRKSVGLTKEKVIKTCPTCGKPFEPSRSDQIYCSKACCNKAYGKANYKKKHEEYASPFAKPKESFLDKRIEEANACGLSYGQYKAQIAMGKTFDELKAIHEARTKRSDDL